MFRWVSILSAGQSTFSIVLDQSLWVVANFKETQFGKIKIGQPVEVEVDAIPGHEFEGLVWFFFTCYGCNFCAAPTG